jgi:hypothetical protein
MMFPRNTAFQSFLRGVSSLVQSTGPEQRTRDEKTAPQWRTKGAELVDAVRSYRNSLTDSRKPDVESWSKKP